MLIVNMLSDIMFRGIMLSAFINSVITLRLIMLNVIILLMVNIPSVPLLGALMLRAVKLSVIYLSVLKPYLLLYFKDARRSIIQFSNRENPTGVITKFSNHIVRHKLDRFIPPPPCWVRVGQMVWNHRLGLQ